DRKLEQRSRRRLEQAPRLVLRRRDQAREAAPVGRQLLTGQRQRAPELGHGSGHVAAPGLLGDFLADLLQELRLDLGARLVALQQGLGVARRAPLDRVAQVGSGDVAGELYLLPKARPRLREKEGRILEGVGYFGRPRRRLDGQAPELLSELDRRGAS